MISYKEKSSGNWEIAENHPFKEQFERIRESCKRNFNKQDTESKDSEYEEESQVQSDSKQQCNTIPILYDLEYVLKQKQKEKKKYEICCKALSKYKKKLEDIANQGKNATGEAVVVLRVKYRETLDITRKLKSYIDKYEAIQFKEELESYHGRLLRSDYGILKIIDSCHIEGEISLRFETEEKQKVFNKDFKSKAEVLNYIKCYSI